MIFEGKVLSKISVKAVIKFGYSEKATKFEKIFHIKFDVNSVNESEM